MKRFVTLLALACLLGACVSREPRDTETVPASIPDTTKRIEPRRPLPGIALDAPAFRGLPGEAGDYLKILAEAFREKDREFLVSQGEAQYESDLRFGTDEEVYLAMLYRTGPYSEDTSWKPPVQRLECDDVEAIEYTAWEEKGPLLKISGRLHLKEDKTIPCEIMLVWRLETIKILGFYP